MAKRNRQYSLYGLIGVLLAVVIIVPFLIRAFPRYFSMTEGFAAGGENSTCTKDGDCDIKFSCQSGKCKPIEKGKSCKDRKFACKVTTSESLSCINKICGLVGVNERCKSDTECFNPTVNACINGLCKRKLAKGTICSSDIQCDSGLSCFRLGTATQSRCHPKLGTNETCTSSSQCISTKCVQSGSRKVCVA